MKIKMKCIIVLIGLLSMISCKQKYALEDITADNVLEKLKVSDKVLWYADFGLFDFKPWEYFVNQPAIKYANPIRVEYKEYTQPNNLRRLSKMDLESNTLFEFVYRGDYEVNSVYITKQIFSDPEVPYANEAVDYLIKEKGFTYKPTNHKNGSDVLMKKIEDDFLICYLNKDEAGIIRSFQFLIYEPK